FRGGRGREFIRDRASQTVFRSGAATATTSAPASGPARPPFAVGPLLGAGEAWLFVRLGLVLFGLAFVGDGAFGHLGRDANGLTVLARCAAFACFTAPTAAPTAPPGGG